MIKSITTGLCLLAFTGSLALAQSGPAMSGGNQAGTGMQSGATDPMNANARMMKKKKMKKGMMKSGSGGESMTKDGMSGGMQKDGMGGMTK